MGLRFMSVIIREMTDEEFKTFYQWSIEHQAAELVSNLHIDPEDALRTATEEISKMLPNGVKTENNNIFSIIEQDCAEFVGFIWTLHENNTGKTQCFICDFAIWEHYRRKGYATNALQLAEKYAFDAGCLESVLFVSDNNKAAQALYQKCGYQYLRQHGCGKYMVKSLL